MRGFPNVYLLFAGCNFYPEGGWGDFAGIYDSKEDCLRALADLSYDWWHIVHDGHIVDKGEVS